MNFHSVINAISEGLKLSKKSFVVFLIYYLFNVLLYIHATEYKEHLQYALFYLPVYLAFVFSVPAILDKIRQNTLTIRSIFSDICISLWRLIIPLCIFVLLFVAPIVYLYEHNPAVLRNFLLDVQKQQTDLALTDFLMSAAILSLFSFTTYFFSLEKRNIISSAFRSISAILHKPLYLLLIVGISFFQILVRNLIEFDTISGNILFAIPTTYLAVIIASVNLIYFRDVIEKPPEASALSRNPIIRWLQTSSPSRNMILVIIALSILYFMGTVPPQM